MKLLAIILPVMGLAGGLAGGHFMAAPPENAHGKETIDAPPQAKAHAEVAGGDLHATGRKASEPHGPTEYAKISKQFVVPVIENDRVSSLIVVNLAVEVDQGQSSLVVEQEPKLRDAFLKVLFNHAQSGGFGGDFTKPHLMDDLRASLYAAASSIVGEPARQVLLTSILRQDY